MKLRHPLTVRRLRTLLKRLPDDMLVEVATWRGLEWQAVRPFGLQLRKKAGKLLIDTPCDDPDAVTWDFWDA